MVQLFQRYVPVPSLFDFVVECTLGITAFAVAIQVAWWLRAEPVLPGAEVGKAAATVALLVLVFYFAGYYERRNHLGASLYFPRLLQAVGLAALSLLALNAVAPSLALDWPTAVTGLFLLSVLMGAWHAVAPTALEFGGLTENVLILGDGSLAGMIADRIRHEVPWGLHLTGFLKVDCGRPDVKPREAANLGDSRPIEGDAARAEPGFSDRAAAPANPSMICDSLGGVEELDGLLADHDIHTLVIAVDDRRGTLPLPELIDAKLRGVTVYEAADFYERMTGRMPVARLRPSSIIFSEGFSPSRITKAAKRVMDLVLAVSILALTLPLQALIGLAIRLDTPGPVLFRQERVGKGGAPFTMFKFRSMRQDAEEDGPRWAASEDGRVTRVGRLLRKLRLDELPQIWNVLRGEMSFVGPRPERPCFVRWLRREIPFYDQRHAIRPGITGWAQVKFPYGASLEESMGKLEYDLYYMKHMSVAFDTTILLETLKVLLWGKGAR